MMQNFCVDRKSCEVQFHPNLRNFSQMILVQLCYNQNAMGVGKVPRFSPSGCPLARAVSHSNNTSYIFDSKTRKELTVSFVLFWEIA